MVITEAKLPPKNGYVEGVDEDGNPVYIPTEEAIARQQQAAREAAHEDVTLAGFGATAMDTAAIVQAEQQRRATQLWLNSIEDEETLQEVATVAPAYQIGHTYKAGELFTYGLNGVGDPQLYRVIKGLTSQANWPPDQTPSEYKAIGLTDDGIPIWAPPTGGHDAYNIGDKVSHNGAVWESLINGNTTVPGSDDRWWKKV